jgi:hypothetical protein
MPNGRAGTRQPGRTALRLALAALTLFVVTCREEDSSPEAAVRRTLAAIEAAARAKDLSAIVEHVSEAYADDRGNDRQAVRQIAAFHLLRNQSVHTLTRIRSVSFPDPGLADAEALVAMAGTAIPMPMCWPRCARTSTASTSRCARKSRGRGASRRRAGSPPCSTTSAERFAQAAAASCSANGPSFRRFSSAVMSFWKRSLRANTIVTMPK